jgi:hypothetical protein
MGDPPPMKAEAIKLISKRFRMTPDAARKLYEKIQKDGPPR